jgi:hypothetical protein
MAAPKKAAAKKTAPEEVAPQQKEDRYVAPSDSYQHISGRAQDAEDKQRVVRRYAYGTEVDTSFPDEVTLPHSGSRSRIIDADAADTAANVLEVDRLAGLLSMKQDGVNTADPEAIVRYAYNMPDVSPPSTSGFLGHYRASRKTEPSVNEQDNIVRSRMAELATNKEFASFRRDTGLRTNSRPERVFEAMVSTRSGKLSDSLSPWYEGAQSGVTAQGVPIYEEGESRKVINRVAAAAGQHPDALRRGTAIGSPKSYWSTKSGKFPNVEGASEVMTRSVANPGMSVKSVSKALMPKDPITGVGLPDRREAIAEMARGEHSHYRSQIQPPPSALIPSAKQSNFDLALVSPHHESYGYSPWVASERSKAFTSDTHDLAVAGIKSPAPYKLDPVTGEELKDQSKDKSGAEKWLGRGASYDLSRASAVVSLGDKFSEQFSNIRDTAGMDVAQDWARTNAQKYTPNNAQASWWVGERGMA